MNILHRFFFLLFFILSLSNAANAQEPFADEIRKFAQADSAVSPIAGQIVLYGSSTLRLWKTAETDCAYGNLKVVNRGFGGSQTVDALRYFERVVVSQRPKYLFFYEGDNDINAGKSVDSVFQDIALFVQKVRQQLPETRLVIFSIKPSPSRLALLPKQQELNKRLWKLAKKTKKVYFLDTATPMLDASGKPNSVLFIQDMLHMKPEGYVLWTQKVQWFLKKYEKY
jgi:lysophospholipase L1-like esterase